MVPGATPERTQLVEVHRDRSAETIGQAAELRRGLRLSRSRCQPPRQPDPGRRGHGVRLHHPRLPRLPAGQLSNKAATGRTRSAHEPIPVQAPKSGRRIPASIAPPRTRGKLSEDEVLLIRLGTQRMLIATTTRRPFIGYATAMSADELRDAAGCTRAWRRVGRCAAGPHSGHLGQQAGAGCLQGLPPMD